MTPEKAKTHRECCTHSLINVVYPSLSKPSSVVIVELRRNPDSCFMCIRCGEDYRSSLEIMVSRSGTLYRPENETIIQEHTKTCRVYPPKGFTYPSNPIDNHLYGPAR